MKKETIELKNGETKDIPKLNKKEQQELATSIGAALRMDMEFKIYTHRISGPENFVNEIKKITLELVKMNEWTQ